MIKVAYVPKDYKPTQAFININDVAYPLVQGEDGCIYALHDDSTAYVITLYGFYTPGATYVKCGVYTSYTGIHSTDIAVKITMHVEDVEGAEGFVDIMQDEQGVKYAVHITGIANYVHKLLDDNAKMDMTRCSVGTDGLKYATMKLPDVYTLDQFVYGYHRHGE
jgi:hypothetical protein